MSINSKDLILFFSHQINKARENPRSFIKFLQQRLNLFQDQYTYQRLDISNVLYKTQQGKQSVKEAIQYLQTAQNVKPLILSMQLCEIAYQMSLKMSSKQRVIDPSQYKQDLREQTLKSNCTIGNIQMIIQYGFRKDYQIVPNILIDDGDSQRNRRHSLMNQNNRFVGIGVQEHVQFDFVVLILITDKIVGQNEGNYSSNSHCHLI